MKLLKLILLVAALVIFSGCSPLINTLDKMVEYSWEFDNTKVHELYDQGKLDEADQIVTNYLKKNPDDYIALGEKAYILISKDQNEEGLLIIDKLLAVDPDDDVLINNKSWAYTNLGLYKLGLEYAEKASELTPDDEATHTNKGNALYGLEKYDEALKSYNKAISINKKAQYAYYGKGRVYEDKKNYAEAYLNYKKAFEINPADDDYFYGLIASSRKLSRYNEMLAFANKRIAKNSKDGLAYTYRAEAYGNLKQYPNALKNYDLALKYTEYKADIFYDKCKLYLKLNKKEEAYINLKNALKTDEEYSEYVDLAEVKGLKGYKDFDKLIAQ